MSDGRYAASMCMCVPLGLKRAKELLLFPPFGPLGLKRSLAAFYLTEKGEGSLPSFLSFLGVCVCRHPPNF